MEENVISITLAAALSGGAYLAYRLYKEYTREPVDSNGNPLGTDSGKGV
jgi:hypothetical protein